ncbi:MAG: hypothetical protein WKF37_10110, partial [Bryobacteraceae bacterium]
MPPLTGSSSLRATKETAERARFNREKFVPETFKIISRLVGAPMVGSGLSFRAATAVAMEGSGVVSGVFPRFILQPDIGSDERGASLSDAAKGEKVSSLQVVGDKLGAYRKIIDHCVIGEDHKFINSDSLNWVKISTHGATNSSGVETVTANLPIYVELSTIADNPRLPERPEKFKTLTDEMVRSGRSYFGITRAVLHDGDEAPKDDLQHMAPMLAGGPVRNNAELARRFEAIVQATLQAWSNGRASDQDT